MAQIMKTFRVKLVDDWKQVHKWISTYGIIALGALPTIYENLGFIQDFVPASVFHYTMGALGAATLAGRLVKQK
jgi:hypothetical protein